MTWPCNCFRGTDPAVEPVDTPGKSFALVPDTLGNVIANKDENGDVFRTCEYWPYGEIRTETSGNPTPFGYGGTWGYYSDPSGLLYVRARYYKPIEGRWLTVDPIWPEESAYGYCEEQPTRMADITGARPEIVGCGAEAKAWLQKICSLVDKNLTNERLHRINRCISDLSAWARVPCPLMTEHRRNCFARFCQSGRVECFRPGGIPGHPNAGGWAGNEGCVQISPGGSPLEVGKFTAED